MFITTKTVKYVAEKLKELNLVVQGAASKALLEWTSCLIYKVLVFVIANGENQALCWGFSYTSYVLIMVVRLE